MNQRLTKGYSRLLCGVCSGLAEYFNIDSTLVRIGYVALTVFSSGFPGVLLYIALAIIMPKPQDQIEY